MVNIPLLKTVGNSVDTIRLGTRSRPHHLSGTDIIQTDYGRLRVLDTGGQKPVILNVPDGPNVIEHHQVLVKKLSKNYRVICFELPGIGFSYPTLNHDYSLARSAKIVLTLMDTLNVERATLCFSCSNSFYAIKAAEIAPHRFTHLFLSQTPSLDAMKHWMNATIPKVLTYPLVGQITNAFTEKKLARAWYKMALPKQTNKTDYERKALNSLRTGGCFCLAGLVQGLLPELNQTLTQLSVPSTQIWGKKDYSHRNTDNRSLLDHLPNCELIEFNDCGHFPELEATKTYIQLINERL